MTPTEGTTPEQRLTIVKHLAAGKSLDMVAQIMRLTRDAVLEIGSRHGYPDTDKLSWAVDVLAKKLDGDQTTAAITPAPSRPEGRLPVSTPRAPAASPRPTLAAVPAARPDDVLVLLNTAQQSPTKRIQRLADKVLDEVATLRQLVADEEAHAAAKEREEREKTEARERVERLKRELADAQAKLRGSTTASDRSTTAAADGPSAKEIRTWATAAGLDVPTRGAIPARIRTAYTAAHDSEGVAS